MYKKPILIFSLLTFLSLCSCVKASSSSSNYESKSEENFNSTSNDQITSNENTSSLNSETTSFSYEGNLKINKAIGYLESIILEWEKINDANKYEVLYKSINDSSYLKCDDMLIREYDNHFRCDILGLKEDEYEIKIIALNDNKELVSSTLNLRTKSHIREGFAFKNGSASGAYNDDGTLKNNAQVIYISKHNAKIVEANIDGTIYKGLQAILDGKQKSGSNIPLDIRIIGLIENNDVDYFSSTSEGIQIKGKKSFQEMNLTIEGVGNDATIKGFGFLIRNCKNVEIRNLGIMNFLDDGISLDTDNSNIWIHNNDLFYGQNKGGDQEKGDGALDTKLSTNITHSFNHFFDSGKSNLQGMKEESQDNLITYHHNWFDHSDSRHPRVRTCSVHVYNNYYDGISKYGIGATMKASIFSEANYFRNTKKPMLISMQGTDVKNGTGTFSNEDGGMIKAYNNHIDGVGLSSFIPYSATNNTQFDAYVASTRDEIVPSSIKAYQGGATYSNFDTSQIMYSYNVQSPEEAKITVTTYAGRVEGGDFKFFFDSQEDYNYNVIPALRKAIDEYKSGLIRIQGENNNDNIDSSQETSIIDQDVEHNFTENKLESKYFKFIGSLSSSKGSINYEGKTLTTALKMESSSEISFTLNKDMNLTLLFNSDFTSNNGIKIDEKKYPVNQGIFNINLKSGEHKITKGDSSNLFYIALKGA